MHELVCTLVFETQVAESVLQRVVGEESNKVVTVCACALLGASFTHATNFYNEAARLYEGGLLQD